MQSSTTILSTVEACDIIGVDRSTLTRWVEAGKVKPLRKLPGETGGYLFEAAEIDRVVAERSADQAQAGASA